MTTVNFGINFILKGLAKVAGGFRFSQQSYGCPSRSSPSQGSGRKE
jgi:hypothetical protein